MQRIVSRCLFAAGAALIIAGCGSASPSLPPVVEHSARLALPQLNLNPWGVGYNNSEILVANRAKTKKQKQCVPQAKGCSVGFPYGVEKPSVAFNDSVPIQGPSGSARWTVHEISGLGRERMTTISSWMDQGGASADLDAWFSDDVYVSSRTKKKYQPVTIDVTLQVKPGNLRANCGSLTGGGLVQADIAAAAYDSSHQFGLTGTCVGVRWEWSGPLKQEGVLDTFVGQATPVFIIASAGSSAAPAPGSKHSHGTYEMDYTVCYTLKPHDKGDTIRSRSHHNYGTCKL